MTPRRRILADLECPFCGRAESKVKDCAGVAKRNKIRRRRECLHCARRFRTAERVEAA